MHKGVKMEKYLSKIKPKHYGIVAFVLSCIGTYVMLSYQEVLSTGRFIFLQGDALGLYMPVVKSFLRDLLAGESLSYTWSMSMGQNPSLCYAFYAWNPFNLLYVLFPFLDENVVAAMIYILKTGLVAWAFQKFSVKVLKREGIESIVFSVFYAMCAFHITYNIWIVTWIDALYMLPLLGILIYRLNKEGKWLELVIGYAYLFITQFYTAYIVGIFTFLFMLAVWIAYGEKKKRLVIMVKYIGSVLLAVGISAVIWLPTLIFILQNNGQAVEEFIPLTANILSVLYNMSWGQAQGMDGIYPYIYCGIPTLILCVLYFINGHIKRKEKICAGVLGVFLLVCMLFLPMYKFMHAFDSPDMLGYRFTFLLSFLMCAIACRQSRYLKEVTLKTLWIVMAILVCIYGVIIFREARVVLEQETALWIVIAGNAVLVVIWLLIYFFGIRQTKNALLTVVLILFVTVAEAASNGYVVGMENNVSATERGYQVYKDSIEAGVAMIDDDDFYRVRYLNDFLPYNSDSWFGYNGISDFSSSRNVVLQETMEKLGHMSSRNVIADAGNTPVTDMLFGIKYVINGIYPYMMALEMPSPTVTENPYALSLGYMVEEDIINYNMDSSNVFDNLDSLLSNMTGEEIDCFTPIPEEMISINANNAWYREENGLILVGKEEGEEVGSIDYSVENSAGKVGYVHFQRDYYDRMADSPILLGGDENSVVENGMLTTSYAKLLLENENGLGVSIAFYPATAKVTDYRQANFCYYNQEDLEKAYDVLSSNQMLVEEYGNGYVDAKVTVSEDRTVLFTSIPYDDAWTVYADGVKIPTHAVVGNAFLALELEPGEHELEFRYKAPGVAAGKGIAAASAGIFALFLISDYIKKRKAKEGLINSDVEDRTE